VKSTEPRGLLQIGAFSRASSLSIKTLRAYHAAGILVPATVDRFTGYRSYTADQLADAAVVLRLRALDLPLEQVRQVLSARDPDFTRAVLEQHQRTMEARLAETERIVAELQSGVAPATHTPVHVRLDAAVHTLRVAGIVDEEQFAEWLGWAFGRLEAFLGESEIEPSGPAGALYTSEKPDESENLELFVPVKEPPFVPTRERDISVGEVPEATVAVLVHIGDYATLGDTYRQLGAWIAHNAEPSGERVREWYIIGPRDVDDPGEYRTEIAWPITA
jgi:DNA-binding transcriptional MerR regulator